MDRREIEQTIYVSALGGGIAAMIGATALQTGSPFHNILIVAGSVGLIVGIAGLLWLWWSAPRERARMDDKPDKHIVGMDVGDESSVVINSVGTAGAPSHGARIEAYAQPGQSVTGVRVTRSAPGVGLSVTQTGPGVGLSVVVGTIPPSPPAISVEKAGTVILEDNNYGSAGLFKAVEVENLTGKRNAPK